MRISLYLAACILLGVCDFAAVAAPVKPVSTGPAVWGSPDFHPSPEDPVGWRGNGSGRYPGADPPTSWGRIRNGGGYATKAILWMTPMPTVGVSCPIIVGDRIFLTAEVSDLVCLDKKSGRVLWIRSNPESEALTPEELKDDPGLVEKMGPLFKELNRIDDDLVGACNSQNPTAAAAVFKRKKDVEKQIADEQKASDKHSFDRYWGQAVFGFSGPTPTSDGKHVCAFFTTGVSVSYDLNGKRNWINIGSGKGSEHGNFASPLLCANKFVVWANEMRGYDVDTGKLLWTNPARSNNTYGSLFRVKIGEDLVAGFQSGYFTRIKDGEAIWGNQMFGDSVATPIVEGGNILASVSKGQGSFQAFKLPDATDGSPPEAAQVFATEWKDDEIPDVKGSFARGYVCSPLFVDGLVYRLTQAGGLIVNDASTGEVVYRKVTSLKPKTQYWNWAGCSASPTFAGKYIYLMDNQGHTLVIEPGKTYKEVAQNFLQDTNKEGGGEQVQNLASPVFEGTRMYYRTPTFLYCIGK